MVEKLSSIFWVAITGLLLHFSLSAQTSLTLNVATAGTLSSLIAGTGYSRDSITNLTLTGNLNGTDIQVIREMAGCCDRINGGYCALGTDRGSLTTLDLSGANIISGGGYYLRIDNYDPYHPSLYTLCYTSDNTISYGIFFGSQLKNIILPINLTSIGDYAFYSCGGLTSFTIPNSVTSIGSDAFAYTELSNIIIPDNVISIGKNAFWGCTFLTRITFPDNVGLIGNYAIAYCSSLTEIYCKNPTPPIVSSGLPATNDNTFIGVNINTCKLYVPRGSATAYKASFWNYFSNIIETDFTDITPINKDNATIKSVTNGIYVKTNIQMPVSVYNLSGQKVYQSIINGNTEIPLNKGIYIVKVNNESEKVIVK